MVELKIQAWTNREKLVMALVDSGYTVRIEERNDPKKYLGKEYFVQVLDADRSPKENTYHIHFGEQVLTKTDAEKFVEHLQKSIKRRGIDI